MSAIPITSVVAVTPRWGIGMNGTLPWSSSNTHLPRDLMYFREITTATSDTNKINAVLMGRLTWESIPDRNRPLRRRLNIVISSTLTEADCNTCEAEVTSHIGVEELDRRVLVAKSLDDALELIERNELLRRVVEKAVVVGGAQLFDESLFHPSFQTLHLTQVATDFPADTFLPERTRKYLDAMKEGLDASVVEDGIVENGVSYRIVEFHPKQWQRTENSSDG